MDPDGRRRDRSNDGRRPDEAELERLLEELRPAELPPFYRTRLLARVRAESGARESSRAGGGWAGLYERFRAPRVAWSVAVVSLAALVIVVSLARDGRVPPAPDGGLSPEAALTAVIDPVAPIDSAVVGAGDVEVVAAIDPPLRGGLVRLYVDNVDVTGLAEVTDSYVVYSPGERFEEGEHIITVEIRDAGGVMLKDVSWLFYALNGDHAGYDERV